jgi:hypothetical protein
VPTARTSFPTLAVTYGNGPRDSPPLCTVGKSTPPGKRRVWSSKLKLWQVSLPAPKPPAIPLLTAFRVPPDHYHTAGIARVSPPPHTHTLPHELPRLIPTLPSRPASMQPRTPLAPKPGPSANPGTSTATNSSPASSTSPQAALRSCGPVRRPSTHWGNSRPGALPRVAQLSHR